MQKHSLAEVIQKFIDSHLDNMHVAMPAKIIRYDQKRQRADVQPTLRKEFADKTIIDRAPIKNVPIVFPSVYNSGLFFPINPEDPVVLVFSERSLDAWKSSIGGQVTPEDRRQHDISDAIAFPGLFPFSTARHDSAKNVLGIGDQDLVITHNIGKAGKEAQIKIKPNGTLEINCGTKSRMIFKQDGTVKLQAPTHLTVEAPGGTTWNGDIDLTGTVTASVSFVSPSMVVNGKELAEHVHQGSPTAPMGARSNTGVNQ